MNDSYVKKIEKPWGYELHWVPEDKPYMGKVKGYSCQLNQRHRLAGITDCDIIEVSTPEMGTTQRLEDDYKRPDETPQQRKKERGEK